MDYNFDYANDSTIYLQVGLNSKERAKEGLEDIARIFYNKGKVAEGSVNERKDGKVKILERYDIKYKDGNVIFEKEQS